jgi:hypothetical protein
MTIKTFVSGADNSLGLVKDIRAEFGGTAGLAPDGRIKQAKISQYYRNGFFVPNLGQNSTIPTSGQVQFSNYFGTRTASAPPQLTFTNSSFEDGLNGWTVLRQSLVLNGGSTILGYPTPAGRGSVFTDNDTQVATVTTTGEYQAPGGGTKSLYMGTGRHVIGAGGTIFGPAIYSNNPVYVVAGTVLTFNWRGVNTSNAGGGDAYSVFGYMLNPLTGSTITILSETSPSRLNPTNWRTETRTFTAAEQGIYHFVFLSGSWDQTAGTVVGAALIIDNIVINNNVLVGGA